MPRDGSAGYSEYTRQKQEHLWLILDTIGGVLNGIIQRHQWANPYILWWDLNGGPGCYHNGSIALADEELSRVIARLRIR